MRNRWFRRLAIAAGSLVAFVAFLVVAVYAITALRQRRTYDVALRAVPVSPDSATLARGEHLAGPIGKCADCHGADLGGKVFIEDPGLGRLVASNITSGGVLPQYNDAQLARAIRSGVRHDGHGLLFMPSNDYNYLSDEDVGAIIAYLRSRPPVSRTLPANELKFLARALWTTGMVPMMTADEIDHAKPAVARVAASTAPEYGHYLANVGGCTGCHGPGLSGGKIPGTPPEWKPASNLTPSGIGRWSESDFRTALRTGRRPDGTPIDTLMPWKASGKMTDAEITALYAYLKTVPAKEFGNH